MPLYSYNDLLQKRKSGKLLWEKLSEEQKNILLIKLKNLVLGKIVSLDDEQNIIFDSGYKVVPQNDDILFLERKVSESQIDEIGEIGKKNDKIFSTVVIGGRRRRTSKTVKRKRRKSKRKMYSRRR
jgi:hypothetical protein